MAMTAIHFDPRSNIENKIKKDEQSPTLNILQPREKQGLGKAVIRKRFSADRFDAEQIRMSEAKALKSAFDLYHEVNNTVGNYVNEHETFFTAAVAMVAGKERSLKVGTDCSGIEAPIQALDNLKEKYEHMFSSEIDPMIRETIKANWNPGVIYEDVTKRDNSKTPYVDIYVAGFPCQPFSVAGKKQGFKDEKDRGKIFWALHDYIDKQRSEIFTLENVKGLATLNNGKYEKAVLKALLGIKSEDSSDTAYHIHHSIVDTKFQGIPQSRPRWYCVGIRKSAIVGCGGSKFFFPGSIPSPKIEEFLDDHRNSIQNESSTAKSNIEKAVSEENPRGKQRSQIGNLFNRLRLI